MNDININFNGAMTDDIMSSIASNIRTGIIDASKTSGDTIISSIEHSSGDLIESFKEEISNEMAIINSVGELLISMTEYIISAKDAFVYVDTIYDSSKI